ncbi:exported hypothetical protein [Candidatus Sulfotelmatobacter kueseliae]|uniref:Lipoprotein n=1 Tax=Candidatus Sulfotelmatobacter kueseliae TaxID=2042962 RepID=A0A2U3LAR9_9BACT|nr:exported hypothetical protein [Candidatus Sulfotelmatobacter kueseliae]
MKLRIVSMVGLGLLLASAVAAQTKVAGKMQCPKPGVVGTAEAGDQAGHRLTLEKNTCPWSTPMEMVGEKSKDGTYVAFSENSPTRASTRGTLVGSMENGDKFYLNFDWAVVKDGKPKSVIESVKGTWAFTGGTGKLEGIKGKGTYTASEDETGGAVSMEGEYSVPAAAATKTTAQKQN